MLLVLKFFVSFPPLEITALQKEHETLLSSVTCSTKYSQTPLLLTRAAILFISRDESAILLYTQRQDLLLCKLWIVIRVSYYVLYKANKRA